MAPDQRPKLVTQRGDLACPQVHKGKLSLAGAAPSVKLTVDGSPVVPVNAVPRETAYTGCTNPDSNGVNHQCAKTTVETSGAARLTVGGERVLLNSDTVKTSNDLSVIFPATIHPAQSKLTAS